VPVVQDTSDMSNCLIMSYSNMMLELKISEVDEMGTEVMGTVDLLFYYKGSLKKL